MRGRAIIRATLSLAAAAALLLPWASSAAPSGKWEKLEGAVLADGYMDGDSFYVRHNNRNVIIRLYFVDSPESDEQYISRNQEQADYFGMPLSRVVPLGKRAGQFTKQTLGGKKFTVWTKWKDAMGSSQQKRYFGIVQVGKEDLADLLVANGLARVYGASEVSPRGETVDAQFSKLRQLERRAKAKRMGAWAKQKKGGDKTVEGMFDAALDELEPGAPPPWLEDEEDVGVYEDKWINVPTVAFLRAEVFINTEQFEDAEIEMRKLLRRFPEHPQKARIEFYLALSIAMQERFEDAVDRFRAWLTTYPHHMLVPDVEYWMPISMYYDGRYKECLPLFNAYAGKYSMSVYAPEASYRAACCLYAMENYEDCIDALTTWMEQYPEHYFRFEATIMKGDALAVLGELDDAKIAYKKALQPAAGPFYYMALTQISRVYKALAEEEDFREMGAVYVQYIKDMPNDGNIIDAAYNAGWAMRQIKRPDQARALYWQMIERHGNTPAWEGFDLMLKDLAGMYPRDTKEYDEELAARYDTAIGNHRMTLAARLNMAQAQRLPKDQQARQLAVFSSRFNVDYLGAETLVWLGESWIENGMADNGAANLEMLLQKYPDSRHVPHAQLLLAQQALEKDDYVNALVLSTAVTENAAEILDMMEATFCRAEALLGLKRYADAITGYNEILANRAAPRRLKPDALLGIGISFEEQREYSQAIAYYQRIYVLYGAYKDAVREAYMRSGACFEKLGDKQAAIKTYNEFLESDYAGGTAEAARARQRLAALTGGTP